MNQMAAYRRLNRGTVLIFFSSTDAEEDVFPRGREEVVQKIAVKLPKKASLPFTSAKSTQEANRFCGAGES